MDPSSIKNHISVASCSDVASIMMPSLNKHGLSFFNFHETYLDGSFVRLSSHQSWTEHFFKQGYHKTLSVPESYLAKPINYFIWLIEDCPEMLTDARDNFGFSNGITIAKRNQDSVAFYGFGAQANDAANINYYLNHLDVLQQYCEQFNDQANRLITKAQKDKINVSAPEHTLVQKVNRHYPLANLIKLSRKQSQCATLLLAGKTAREIAEILNLSVRTVESYVDHLKLKCGVYNKTELILALNKLML